MNINNVIIPDLILEKEGIKCGDKVSLIGEIDNNILKFKFLDDNSCSIAKQSILYFSNLFNNKDVDYINSEVKKYIDDFDNDNKKAFDILKIDSELYKNRYECILVPLRLLLEFIYKYTAMNKEFYIKSDTFSSMKCDACTGACEINWNNKKRIVKQEEDIFNYDNMSKWLRLGKIELNQSDIHELGEKCSKMSDTDFKFLSDLTMNSIVYSHLKEYYPELLNDNRWKASGYLIQKNRICYFKFKEVLNCIKKNKLDIYPVKGYVTQNLYADPFVRIHSDYDLISKNSTDALKLAHILIKQGFKIRPNLFSLKYMFYKGKKVLTGHFHVQKVIDDFYNFELDISFPGFPINRTEIYYPKVINNSISFEDQIVITLLHLFKHEKVFIKDINDLFYLLKQDLDLEYLNKQLDEYNLKKYFSLTLNFLEKEYDMNIGEFRKKFNIIELNVDDFKNWPYDLNEHLKIKMMDYKERNKDRKEDERVFLYPIVIFYDMINTKDIEKKLNYKIEKIGDDFVKIINNSMIIYLTRIGIFIENYTKSQSKTRLDYIEFITEILNELDIKKCCDIAYETDHFYVRVY